MKRTAGTLLVILALGAAGAVLWSAADVEKNDDVAAIDAVRALVTEYEAVDANAVNLKTYASVGNGFSLRYPAAAFTALNAGDEGAARRGHHVPPCDDGFVACLMLSDGRFAGTNFDSAGIGIFRTAAAGRQACEATQHGAMRDNVRGETVNGQDFVVFESGTAAMSHAARDTVHLAWRNNACYEVVSRIAFSRFEVYEPGTIEELTATDIRDLGDDLHAVVASFRFAPGS